MSDDGLPWKGRWGSRASCCIDNKQRSMRDRKFSSREGQGNWRFDNHRESMVSEPGKIRKVVAIKCEI